MAQKKKNGEPVERRVNAVADSPFC